MARQRSPDRDKAFVLWKDSGGEMKLKDIAAELGISDSQIRKWKNQDEWEQKINSNVTNDKSNATKSGAPFGNKNAVGNPGNKNPKWGNKNAVGHGAPLQNDNAVTHGFFRKHFPEDVADLAAEIMEKNPIDMLWENITIQYTAIIRAQRLMFVKDQEDTSREIKKETDMGTEYEIQFAWDKHATFLNAQSRAMSTLSSLIRDFDKLANIDDERRLKLEAMKLNVKKVEAEVKKLSGSGNDGPIEIIVKRKGED
ncbi:phage terminase small subunit [Bacillus paranthracis]|uniref:phage terminase small subunit n=1 Tax=Bacillus cereus group TaxID=86661 RepID=UPI0022DFADA8|nr:MULTISPECIES: phage terminase small subunit [Bacillus cereus group]MDA1747721.1 phage terminase small subunit [Bacillus cereus group sp. LD121LC]MDK7418674.1 phage terminase small subunit [Bacillus paranthracis]MDK7430215.1 phage terminase small subunit [Bacillus paranthracis]MDK7518978.1 phage terminase small subunit [Bacillus paranthracis]MDK7571807.1 phage terminase small subunit [Bacillus paranthracis]